MKIGSRCACDTCGRVETPKLQVFPHLSKKNSHLCETCKQELYYENISAVARKNDNRKMV